VLTTRHSDVLQAHQAMHETGRYGRFRVPIELSRARPKLYAIAMYLTSPQFKRIRDALCKEIGGGQQIF
jgi:hypothetical protein